MLLEQDRQLDTPRVHLRAWVRYPRVHPPAQQNRSRRRGLVGESASTPPVRCRVVFAARRLLGSTPGPGATGGGLVRLTVAYGLGGRLRHTATTPHCLAARYLLGP